MRNRLIWFAAAMALGLCLCRNVCPKAAAEEIHSAEASEAMEEYKAVPYRLYPTSPNAWVGDVMPMSDGNELKLYYLYDTDHNGPLYHPIHLFSTENLYDYRDHGRAIKTGPDQSAPDSAIGTGSVLVARDGMYHAFYTGHNDANPGKGLDKECVMHAVSEDGLAWKKLPEDTFYAPAEYSGDDFRDPFVFWNEEAGCYWLLIAARNDDIGGIVARYRSDDLAAWELMEPLFAPHRQYMLECPDLFRMGDKWYLFYSWDKVTYYAVSDSINGPFAEAEDCVLASNEFSFYAAKTAELNGTRYLCGWIGRKYQPKDAGGYGWAGSLMLHELVQNPDGTLGIREPHTLEDYFVRELPLAVTASQGTAEQTESGWLLTAETKKDLSVVSFGPRRATFELECDVNFSQEGFAGFCFGEGQNFGNYSGLVLDPKNNSIHFEGTVLSRMAYVEPLVETKVSLTPGVDHHVKLIMENEIVTVYVDNAKVLCVRIYKAANGGDLGLFAVKTQVEFKNLTVKIPET